MSDDKKLTLGARPTLGAKKTVEAGKVRQSFSHGRTNSVVVEIKQRRPMFKPGAEEAPPPPPVVTPPPVLPPVAKAPPRPQMPAKPARDASLSSGEVSNRQEALQQALRRAEQERMEAAEKARRRDEQERQEKAEAERQAREANRRGEDAAPPEDLPPPVEEKIVERGEDRPAVPEFVDVPPVRGKEAGDDGDDRAVRSPGKGAPVKLKQEVAKPVRPRVDERRQSGKLTVTRALESDDQTRVRSLAALRRAREKERRAHQQGQTTKQVRDVTIPETITVQELANRMAERAGDVIKSLFRMGVVATLTQSIDQDTAELIVSEFGHNVNRVSESDVEIGLSGEIDTDTELQPRAPVVTIMGHVDHGKTSLLDALRNTDVAAGEAGGITQHIGAYQVNLKSGERITFLDTPGHEAFTAMRARGANVTDIAILVVAADDGIMPQTIESINHAKAAGVPIIVAINKIDKPAANADKVRQVLLQHEVVVEKMSGEVQDVEVSALKKIGLDELAGAILAQAELLELRANPNRPAEGTIIEAKLDKGRGPVATVLIKRGTLKVGDIFVAGAEWGKVRALLDDKGRQIKSAGPSAPVEILGISGAPGAGDDFSVVENEARAREVAAYRQTLQQRKRQAVAPTTLESMFSQMKAGKAEDFPIIVKGDVQGSVEAIAGALDKLSTEEIRVRILHSGVGGISESDVTLAEASRAPIIGFNVRANKEAREAAERTGIAINYYSIIYNLVDEVKAAMAGKLGPQRIETVFGRAAVRDVFTAGKAGKAAGCYVTEGTIKRNAKARLMRDDVIVYTGSLSSLRRFKDDVPEVRTGLECGMTLENYQDIKQGDVIEVYEITEIERVL